MKKIILVLNDSRRSFTYERVAGLCESIKHADLPINLYIFRSAGFSEYDPSHNYGEYNIYRLPDFSDYDGIILDINNVRNTNENLYEAKGASYVVRAAAASGRPVISIANRLGDFYFLGIDNRKAMTSMISYLHKTFFFKDFWFIMGPKDNYENILRTEALKDYCKENRIPCDPLRFYSESFALDCGINGFEKLYSINGGKLPQAIICANDPIALGTLRAARAHGIKIPGDVYITGFDNLDISAYLSPTITTIDQYQWKVGSKCLEIFERIWAGEEADKETYMDTGIVERESTGGQKPSVSAIEDRMAVSANKDLYIEKVNDRICTMQYNIPACRSIDEICASLVSCIPDMKCRSLWLALDRKLFDYSDQIKVDLANGTIRAENDVFKTDGYPDDIEIVFSWDKKKGASYPHDKLSGLFPYFDYSKGGRNYMFIPLHFMRSTVGFLAISDCMELLKTKIIASFVNTLTMALRSFFSAQKLEYINSMLSGISMSDSLTGLCNRLGYHHLASELFDNANDRGERIGVLFIDMDRMKWFNDTFGHACGDDAIRCLASSIKQSISSEAIAVRFGGDEFLVLTPVDQAKDMDKIVSRITKTLPAEAKKLNLPDVPGISTGYIITDPNSSLTLNEYVEEADKLMYSEKTAKRASRK